MAGYHWLADQSWVDAFLNAAMLLGGMGPVGELHTTSAKIFAGVYALYAGIVFLVLAAMLLGPVFHRVLHHFHWEADQEAQEEASQSPSSAARGRSLRRHARAGSSSNPLCTNDTNGTNQTVRQQAMVRDRRRLGFFFMNRPASNLHRGLEGCT